MNIKRFLSASHALNTAICSLPNIIVLDSTTNEQIPLSQTRKRLSWLAQALERVTGKLVTSYRSRLSEIASIDNRPECDTISVDITTHAVASIFNTGLKALSKSIVGAISIETLEHSDGEQAYPGNSSLSRQITTIIFRVLVQILTLHEHSRLDGSRQKTCAQEKKFYDGVLFFLITRVSELVKTQAQDGSAHPSTPLVKQAAVESRCLAPMIAWILKESPLCQPTPKMQGSSLAGQQQPGFLLTSHAQKRFHDLLWTKVLGDDLVSTDTCATQPQFPDFDDAIKAAENDIRTPDSFWLLAELENLLGIDLLLDGL